MVSSILDKFTQNTLIKSGSTYVVFYIDRNIKYRRKEFKDWIFLDKEVINKIFNKWDTVMTSNQVKILKVGFNE